ncbi:hypothetical protein BADSM9389_27320 [Buttiauxella agrestis]|nr:hypothetical protein BADSM9389_27320 [Buttiauxella agrestis]
MLCKCVSLAIKTALIKLAMNRAKQDFHAPALPCARTFCQVSSLTSDTKGWENGFAFYRDYLQLMVLFSIRASNRRFDDNGFRRPPFEGH